MDVSNCFNGVRKTEDWLVAEAAQAWEHPRDHALEIGAAAVGLSLATVATGGLAIRYAPSALRFLLQASPAAESLAANAETATAITLGGLRPKLFDIAPEVAQQAQKEFDAMWASSQASQSVFSRSLDGLHHLSVSLRTAARVRAFPAEAQSGRVVGQAAFATAGTGETLATHGLGPCRGLIINNRRAALQYLAHVDVATTADEIKQSLANFPLVGARAYLARGLDESPVEDTVRKALGEIGLKRIRVIQTDGTIVSRGGKLFSGPADIRSWASHDLPDATPENYAAWLKQNSLDDAFSQPRK